MAIQLGTVAPIGFDEFPIADLLDCYRKLGCKVVQAYRNHKAGITVSQMQDAIAAGAMPCDSLHGVYGEQFDPSNPSESDRIRAVDAFKSEGDLVLQLGGSLVVVHCSTIRKDGISQKEHAQRRAQLRKSIVELGAYGQSISVRYAFENLPGYHAIGADVGELSEILSDLDAPNTGMCFDTGHAHMVGKPVNALTQANGCIIYVHFSDNCGQSDDHEMATCGTLDTDAVARALHDVQYTGTMMLECFYGVDRLKQLIDDGCAERLARIVQLANGRSK